MFEELMPIASAARLGVGRHAKQTSRRHVRGAAVSEAGAFHRRLRLGNHYLSRHELFPEPGDSSNLSLCNVANAPVCFQRQS